mgnify:CR=1 FL=1
MNHPDRIEKTISKGQSIIVIKKHTDFGIFLLSLQEENEFEIDTDCYMSYVLSLDEFLGYFKINWPDNELIYTCH